MADPQKKNSSVSEKEKDPLQDLELGGDFFSWKSISIAEGDAMDFDLTPASKGNKKTFNFDKTDMDFNFDADFGKMSSFNLDMSDLDISPPLKKDPKPKEKAQEPSNGKDKGKKTDHFGFGFDFDELDNFNFDSTSRKKEGTKAQKDENNKESSPKGVDCQGKEGSVHINESGSKSTLKDGSQKPSLPESRITFDMDFEPMREPSPNLAMDDGVTPEHSAASVEGASDRVKDPLQTKVSSEIQNISPSKRLVPPGRVDLEACTKNDVKLDLSSDYLLKHEPSGRHSLAMEKRVDSADTNASNSIGQKDTNMTFVADSTCNYKHTISRNSQHHQTVAVSENVDETSGVKPSAVENKVSCTDTDVSSLHGEDANMTLVAGSTSDYEAISEPVIQGVAISENTSAERTQDGIKNHVEDGRGRSEIAQTISHVELSCVNVAESGVPCDIQSSREDQKPSHEIRKSSIISQPADELNKQIENIQEPVVSCSRPLIQLEKSECPMLKASIQTNFTSSSSKQMGFAQPSLLKGRDASQSVGKLSLQCSKTLLRGIIPQIQSQKSCSGLKIQGDTPAADVLKSGNKLNDSGTEQVEDVTEKKSAPRQREMWAKDLHTLSVEANSKEAEYDGNSKKLASILLYKNTFSQEQRTSSNEVHKMPPDLPGLKLSRLSIDSTKSPILRESKPVGNSSRESVTASKSSTGIAHLPDKCMQALSIDSTKSSISREGKLLETSSQKSVLISKTPSGTAHLPEKCKQTTSTLSVKRTLEDDAADTSVLHPAKRLSQSVATTRNLLETSEKVLENKAPIHSRKDDDYIKSTTRDSRITPFEISHEVKTKAVEISSSEINDSNIKLADACSKGLDDLYENLRKKHDEAKELLVQAIVNSNKLLMLSNPQFEEKIRATRNLFAGLTLNSIQG